LKHAEQFVHERGGRWLLAETSAKDQYDKTRSFYLKNEYTVIAEIPDFYSRGDGMIVFAKNFVN
jgi:aminoglycoside 6'-N-acetyltransferase I